RRLVAEPRQRVLDPRRRAQRDAALQRAPALEHGDLQAEPPPDLRKGRTSPPLAVPPRPSSGPEGVRLRSEPDEGLVFASAGMSSASRPGMPGGVADCFRAL